MPGGVLFTPDAADRIADAVEYVEGHYPGGRPPARRRPATSAVETFWARLTSGTADGNGNYPAVITVYDSSVPGWVDYGAVKVKPVNGETLVNGTRYQVQPAGVIGTDQLFATVVQGSGGAGGSAIRTSLFDGTFNNTGCTWLRFNGVMFLLAQGASTTDVDLLLPSSGNVILASDFTVSSGTMTDITGMSFTLPAAYGYVLWFDALASAKMTSGAGGVAVQLFRSGTTDMANTRRKPVFAGGGTNEFQGSATCNFFYTPGGSFPVTITLQAARVGAGTFNTSTVLSNSTDGFTAMGWFALGN